MQKIRQNEKAYEGLEYAILIVDQIRKQIKFINLRSNIFKFFVCENQKYCEISDYFEWPVKAIKCRISIFNFEFSFFLQIQEIPQKLRTCSLEPKIFKIMKQTKDLNQRTLSLKSGAEDDQLERAKHQITHRLNKSMNLRFQVVEKQGNQNKNRDKLSMISMERLTSNQRFFGCESEENGPPQRREHTVRTDVRTESEWFGFIPSKEIAFKIGSEDSLRPDRQLRKEFKTKDKIENEKDLLGKRSCKEVIAKDQLLMCESIERRFLNKNPNLRIQEMRINNKPLEHRNEYLTNAKIPCKTSIEASPRVSKCVICFDQIKSFRGVLDCDHSFCYECIKKWLVRKSTCPICKINPRLIRKFKLNQFLKSEFTRQWRNRSFAVPIPIRRRWVVHEMESENEEVDFNCLKCGLIGDISSMVQCIRCHLRACHMDCLWKDSRELPDYQWLCDHCVGSRSNRNSYGRKSFSFSLILI